MIRDHILLHIKTHLSVDQHGFIGGRSCTSNLLETLDKISSLLDDKNPVDILYFDFKKAFDSVPHYRLVRKLERFGIDTVTLSIISDFLSQRTMRVSIAGEFSESSPITSGVPQGSVLGPLKSAV